jgi:hypothetical protein
MYERPARRKALLIAAPIVWGATIEAIVGHRAINVAP